MYSQFQNNFQNQAGASGIVNSQYRGYETKYQPVGFVQSQYNSSINQGANNQFNAGMNNMNNQQQFVNNQQQFASSYSQQQSPQAYHTASYRGNQQGHDAYLRSDSTQPAQSQYGIGAASGINNSAYTSTSFGSNAFQANQPNNQYQSAQSFHTAGYRGDQPGHDAYLRSDSTQTAQSQYGIGASSYANSPYTSSFSTGINSNQQQMGTGASYSQFQNQSPQSYHTASYRGNQQGHDAYLRSDSTQPAQSQYGMGASGMNRYQF